jgi:hypothetical protein
MGISRLVRTVVGRAVRWPVASQEVSRRNAMLAGTELTQRRAERLEVEEFFDRLVEQRVSDRVRPPRVG